jgi:hypothetical protein
MQTSLSTSKMVASGGGHGYVRLLMDLVNAIDNLVTGNATLEEFWKVRPARRAIFFVYSENFAYLSFSLNSPTNLFLSTHQRSSQISVPRSLSFTTLRNPTRDLEESTSLSPHVLALIARP